MSKELRAAVRSIILETMFADAGDFGGYKGVDLDATCKHCHQDLWLVWEASNPMEKWTECGGVGEGSCDGRYPGEGHDEEPFPSTIEPVPPTMRAGAHPEGPVPGKRSV